MRKSVLLIMMLFAVSMAANAQKFALIDTEYIMKIFHFFCRTKNKDRRCNRSEGKRSSRAEA